MAKKRVWEENFWTELVKDFTYELLIWSVGYNIYVWHYVFYSKGESSFGIFSRFLTGSWIKGNFISGTSEGLFVRTLPPWICYKICQMAAEWTCAFRWSSATLSLNKTSWSLLTSFSSVSFPFPVNSEFVKTKQTIVKVNLLLAFFQCF